MQNALKPNDNNNKAINTKNFKSTKSKSVSNKNDSYGNTTKLIDKKILPKPKNKSLKKKPHKRLPKNSIARGSNISLGDSCMCCNNQVPPLYCFKNVVINNLNE
jgi:hypothetical protein